MGRLGGGELLLILGIALLLFGPSRLAGLGKGLGEGLKSLKEGLRDHHEPTPPVEGANAPPGATPPEAQANPSSSAATNDKKS
jgi:sec-independent protein translocase protein TatA